MNRNNLIFTGIVLLFTYGCSDMTEGPKTVKMITSFGLDQVRLLDGPFLRAQELDEQTLLGYEPDRFLSRFRSEAGLEPKAPNYGGWEALSLAGHSLGHYMSACAMMYQNTGKEEYRDRLAYIVSELALCQEAHGDGYLGAIVGGKKILEEEVANGHIVAHSFNLNGIWAPFYSQHKILAGLRDAYRLAEIDKALEVERKFADWIDGITKNLTQEQMQEVLACEHGGVNEIFVDLYRDTGDQKYLDLADRFYHEEVLVPLSEGKDILPGIHGNTQIPKIIGLARRYELTNDKLDRKTAQFFWDRVVNHHTYVTGGHGNHEYFGPPDQLSKRLSDESTETCNVYNMLKLTHHLMQWQAKQEYADFYERALINQILSSQNPKTGEVLYNQSLEMGGKKEFQDPSWFTCCIGSGMENHASHAKAIYYKGEDELYVSQFIASELTWKDMGYTVRQETRFPSEEQTNIVFETNEPKTFTLNLRFPYWAIQNFRVFVNGGPINPEGNPGSFISITRTWADGDLVEVRFPFSIRLESTPDNPNRTAVMYGPLVMAGNLNDWDASDYDLPSPVPVIRSESENPADWMEVTGNNQFRTKVGYPVDFELKPLHMTYDNRYSVYWDVLDDEAYESAMERKEAKSAEFEALRTATFDVFWPGDSLEELAHNFDGDSIYVQNFRGKKARVANRGGRFSFDMAVPPDKPVKLVLEYWGGFTGGKTFDILAGDKIIGTENISGMADGEFVHVDYSIPYELTKGNSKVRIYFEPLPGNRAGPFFSAWIVAQ